MKWTPPTKKPSAELCRLLAALKPGRRQPPLGPMEKRVDALEKRLMAKVKPGPNGCIEWSGALRGKGYGLAGVGSKNMRAHRLSWMLYRGDIPDGLLVCHSCDNRKCINPDHLWLGSNHDNLMDALRKGRLFQPPRGTQNILTKLTAEAVVEIRQAFQKRTCSHWGVMKLAKKYGVSRNTISRVAWGHSCNQPEGNP